MPDLIIGGIGAIICLIFGCEPAYPTSNSRPTSESGGLPPPAANSCVTIPTCSIKGSSAQFCGPLGVLCLNDPSRLSPLKKSVVKTEKWKNAEPVDISKLHNRFRYGFGYAPLTNITTNGNDHSNTTTIGNDSSNTTTNGNDSSNTTTKGNDSSNTTTEGKEGQTVERIVGGVEASPNSFPWAVAIIINKAWFCGGSIISDTWVLTAAHCTEGGTTFHIQVGAHNITAKEPPRKLSILSTVAIQHENYDNKTLANDIALIRLPSPLTFNDYIQPIGLSDFTASAGYRTTAMGWGLTATGGSVSNVLRVVDDLPILGNDDCSSFFGGIINNGTLCVDTSGQKGTCQGDSGGVLALQDQEQKWIQVGVTSFGSASGCEAEYPVGFARVEFYLDWIKTNANTCD